MVIGTYWRAHHRLFRWVRNYDNRLVSINMRLLLCVSFIPCPTAFYSQYPGRADAADFLLREPSGGGPGQLPPVALPDEPS